MKIYYTKGFVLGVLLFIMLIIICSVQGIDEQLNASIEISKENDVNIPVKKHEENNSKSINQEKESIKETSSDEKKEDSVLKDEVKNGDTINLGSQHASTPGDEELHDSVNEDLPIKIDLKGDIIKKKPASAASTPKKKKSTTTTSQQHHVSKKQDFNYASADVGAKILGAPKEAQGSSRVLNENTDKYMYQPRKSGEMFVIIELSEEIMMKRIALANFEYFSCSFKTFHLYGATDLPKSGEGWKMLGTYEAENNKHIQTFALKKPTLTKYIKIVVTSYYNTKEFYCTLSLVRVHGDNMYQDLKEFIELENKQAAQLKPKNTSTIKSSKTHHKKKTVDEEALLQKLKSIASEDHDVDIPNMDEPYVEPLNPLDKDVMDAILNSTIKNMLERKPENATELSTKNTTQKNDTLSTNDTLVPTQPTETKSEKDIPLEEQNQDSNTPTIEPSSPDTTEKDKIQEEVVDVPSSNTLEDPSHSEPTNATLENKEDTVNETSTQDPEQDEQTPLNEEEVKVDPLPTPPIEDNNTPMTTEVQKEEDPPINLDFDTSDVTSPPVDAKPADEVVEEEDERPMRSVESQLQHNEDPSTEETPTPTNDEPSSTHQKDASSPPESPSSPQNETVSSKEEKPTHHHRHHHHHEVEGDEKENILKSFLKKIKKLDSILTRVTVTLKTLQNKYSEAFSTITAALKKNNDELTMMASAMIESRESSQDAMTLIREECRSHLRSEKDLRRLRIRELSTQLFYTQLCLAIMFCLFSSAILYLFCSPHRRGVNPPSLPLPSSSKKTVVHPPSSSSSRPSIPSIHIQPVVLSKNGNPPVPSDPSSLADDCLRRSNSVPDFMSPDGSS